MSVDREKDNRTPEQIFSDIDKRGWAFGRRATPEEHSRAVERANAINDKVRRKQDKAFYKELDNSFKEKSSVLLLFAKVFTKVFHVLGACQNFLCQRRFEIADYRQLKNAGKQW